MAHVPSPASTPWPSAGISQLCSTPARMSDSLQRASRSGSGSLALLPDSSPSPHAAPPVPPTNGAPFTTRVSAVWVSSGSGDGCSSVSEQLANNQGAVRTCSSASSPPSTLFPSVSTSLPRLQAVDAPPSDRHSMTAHHCVPTTSRITRASPSAVAPRAPFNTSGDSTTSDHEGEGESTGLHSSATLSSSLSDPPCTQFEMGSMRWSTASLTPTSPAGDDAERLALTIPEGGSSAWISVSSNSSSSRSGAPISFAAPQSGMRTTAAAVICDASTTPLFTDVVPAATFFGLLDSEPRKEPTSLAAPAKVTHNTGGEASSAVPPETWRHTDGELQAHSPAESQPGSSPTSTLSSEQQYAYNLAVREHRNIFITGGAGTGKSHLLRTIIQGLPYSSTFVTATTGIAALNLGGTTLHSFVGCGIPNRRSTRDDILGAVRSKIRCVQSWRACRVLIIDEVSMLEASFFDLVDYIARCIRLRLHEPFGGIQLILSGDFLQLPPVSRDRRGSGANFCFETVTWRQVNPRICLLSTPFRQRDLRFFEVLNEMRFGELKPESAELLYALDTTERVNFVRRREVPAVMPAEIKTEVSEISAGVKREVDPCVEASERCAVAFRADRTGGGEDNGGGSPVGARPMRLEVVNGFGRPIDAPFDGYTFLRATRAEVDAQNQHYYEQLTTEILYYRGTHRGQGGFPEQTLSPLVALRKGCRVMLIKNIDPRLGLVNGSTGSVTGFVSFGAGYCFKTANLTHQDARSVCVGRGANREKLHTLLPVVEFDLRRADGSLAKYEIVVEPQEWKEMLGMHELSRSVQIPLILAYAITIHKSQGMSLTQVDIDFKKVFEAGQSYVALSRCTDMNQVRLHGFDAHSVHPNERALAYYKALALQQQRLKWRQQHRARVVAEEVEREAFSGTPYGYYLPEVTKKAVSEDQVKEELETAETVLLRTSLGGEAPKEEEDDTDGSTSEFDGHGQLSVHRDPFRITREPQPPYRVPSRAAAAEEEEEGEEKEMNETERLEKLRQRITPLLRNITLIKHLVMRTVRPLYLVRNLRIVMDINALFHLVTGPQSAEAFDIVFGEHGNMMRVPRCVQKLIEEAAAYRSCSSMTTPYERGHMGTGGGEALKVNSERTGVDDDTASVSSSEPLLTASNIAAEALAVMEQAKRDFILDVQRPEQTSPLPMPDPGWLRFVELLPLLQRPRESPPRIGTTATGDSENDDEVNFLLQLDPRETAQHHAILEYAVYMQGAYGHDSAVCTDSFLLAAYALASGLRVVSFDYLCHPAAAA